MNVILVIERGIPNDPILIEGEHDTLMEVAKLAKQHKMKYDFDSLGTYSDQVMYDFYDALDEHFNSGNTGVEIRVWDIEPIMINEE